MKSLLKLAVASALCACLVSSQALAFDPVPHKLNVQGVLRNVAGEVVTGTYNVTFSLYNVQTGGTAVHTELQTLTVTGGVFSAYIGPVNPTVFVNQATVYLGIKIGSDAELPRKPVTAVGFAIQAEHAEQADELLGAATNVDCASSPCIGANEVTFNWALGVSPGGDAAGLTCTGCVSGGAGGDIGSATITSINIANGAVGTLQIASGAVDNARLAANAVTTGIIFDGQVMTADLQDGAVTSTKIGAGAVTNTQIGVLYALSDAKGGPALDLKCDNNGCVNPTEVSFNYAAGDAKGGAATGVACTTACIDPAEVTFNYAGSTSKGGPATGLACTDCVTAPMAQFNYAGSTAEGGPAVDLVCTGGGACVDQTEVTFNYAGSTSKGGPASGLSCVGCVQPAALGFNWAAGDAPGGSATGVACSGCVDGTDLANGSVTDGKITGTITGSKVATATTTSLGVVQIGTGISITSGIITPTWGTAAGTVAQGNHTHAGFYQNGVDDFNLGFGKKFYVLDSGDSTSAYYAYLAQASGAGDNQTGVKVALGFQNSDATYFRVVTESGTFNGTDFEVTGAGNGLIRNNFYIGGQLTCTGCVPANVVGGVVQDNKAIQDGSITGVDIKAGSIPAGDLDPAMAFSTSSTVSAGTAMYAPIYYDSNNTAFYADPNQTSRMSGIVFDSLKSAANQAYGISGTTFYADSIVQGTNGGVLNLVNANCGNISVFGGGCANTGKYMQIHGNLYAYIMYDNNDSSWYVDPNNQSRLAYVTTANGSWLNNPNGWHYFHGPAYVTNSTPWYDYNDGNYYFDLNGTSRFNLMYSNGQRLYNSWPGDPYGFAQMANSGGHLYIGPDANASQMIIFRQGNDDRFYWLLAGAANTGRPSVRTNGSYLVMNPGTGDRNIYFLWDTGGNTHTNGNAWVSGTMVDEQNAAYCIKPSGASQIYNLWAPYIRGNYGFVDNFRVYNLGVWGGGGVTSNDGGIRLNAWASISPGDGQGVSMVGHSERSFWAMHSYNYWGASNREKKRDIKYLNDQDMEWLGNTLHSLKPTTFFYKQEVPEETEGVNSNLVRQTPHIGLILDEMPDVLTAGGTAWSLNDSIGFMLVAGKYLEDENRAQKARIRDLEDRIALLEQAMVDAGLLK